MKHTLRVAVMTVTAALVWLSHAPAEADTSHNQKMISRLQGLYKMWDKDKDGSVNSEELEKFYSKLKRKKSGPAVNGVPQDPMAPVYALFTKVDGDKDGQMSRREFDEWAVGFSDYAAEYINLYERYQAKRPVLEQKMVEMHQLWIQQKASRPIPRSAVDSMVADKLRQGVGQYASMIKDLDKELAQFEAKGAELGHTEYQALLIDRLVSKR